MTPETKRKYKSARANEQFNTDLIVAGSGFKPSFFSDNTTKCVYTAIYQGWLLGKYGDKYEDHI